jgi:hypothetical protein
LDDGVLAENEPFVLNPREVFDEADGLGVEFGEEVELENEVLLQACL